MFGKKKQQSSWLSDLQAIVGSEGIRGLEADCLVYDSDAYPLEKATPLCTVLPKSTEEVSAVVKWCNANKTPFAPRGAGTGLAGGALCSGGVIIGLARMNRILEIDLRNRRMTAQAGAVNIMLTKAVSADGFYYAPDPSSQGASTLGGNVANNAGGPHTLKYGVTSNHLLGVELVLPDGEILKIGDKTEDVNGYDLLGLVCGGEGTLGIVTTATVRLTKTPEAVQTLLAIFDTPEQATATVSEIMRKGITPAALEMMDALILQTVEDAFHFGFPRNAGAILIVELDGVEAGLAAEVEAAKAVCVSNGVREMREAKTPVERAKLWMARKKAVGTLGRLAPACVTQDGVIPRSTLPRVLSEIAGIASRYNLRIANVFHAGDGNLHPAVLFNDKDPEEIKRVVEANHEILKLCVEVGGTLSGEHGIGLEKRDYMPLIFPPASLATMSAIRDCFNPNGLCNPDKVLPSDHGCSYEFSRPTGAVAV